MLCLIAACPPLTAPDNGDIDCSVGDDNFLPIETVAHSNVIIFVLFDWQYEKQKLINILYCTCSKCGTNLEVGIVLWSHAVTIKVAYKYIVLIHPHVAMMSSKTFTLY